MKIFIHELTDLDTELDFTEAEDWVEDAVSQADENTDDGIFGSGAVPRPETLAKNKTLRPIHAHFNLRKVDEVVVVNGKVKTQLRLLCSRCAAPFMFSVSLKFSALFCKDPVMAGIAHLDSQQGVAKPAGQNKGFARHAHDETSDDSSQDLDITYLSEDFIELGDVLSEQLQLQVPFQPLCKETCQGICTQCGADLNVGRCACAKIIKQTPFAVLKNLKL